MDPKDTSNFMDTHQGSPPMNDDVTSSDAGEKAASDCLETRASSPDVGGSIKMEFGIEYEDATSQNVDETSHSRDQQPKIKGQTETKDSGEKVSVNPHQRKTYSVSVPAVSGGKKQLTLPLKKKGPILIRNISTISDKAQMGMSSDSEGEVTDSVSVKTFGNSEKKTICISEINSQGSQKKSRLSLTHMEPQNKIPVDGSVSSDLQVSRVSQNEELVQKANHSLSSPGSSQASPYNTRFSHMKVGTIFSTGNRSSSVSKRKISKDYPRSNNENMIKQDVPVVRYGKPDKEESELGNGVCFLCGIAFADDMGVTLNVKKPLPISNVDFASLLESFSISCSPLKNENCSYVHICNVCHTLVIEGDSTYKHLLSVASEMREQWPFRIKKENPVFSFSFPDSTANHSDNYENKSKSNIFCDRQEKMISVARKSRGRVGRPPKHQIKVEKDADENWKPTQIKLENAVPRRRGRPPKGLMKRKGRGRPRKIVIKGEVSDDEVFTCGLCGESFLEEDGWASHFESDHKVQWRWIKYVLQKKMKKLIFSHIQQSFLNDDFKGMTCPACDEKFLDRNDYIVHLRSVHNMMVDTDFIKSLYDYSQGHFEHLNDMSASETEREENDISSDGTVKIKKEIIPPSEAVEKTHLKCKVCNLVVDSEKALKEHTDTSHFSLVVITGDNSKEVIMAEGNSAENEVSEKSSHTTNPSEISGKENVEDSELICEECEEVFSNRRKLLEHKLNIHGSNDDKGFEKGLVRYECEVCGRRIYGLAALRVHMSKVHYKMPSSFKHCCNLCIYKSQSRSQLGKHMRMQHGKEIMPSVQCETCGKMYGPSYIAKHIATMHSTHPRNFECNFCDMKFYDLAGLKFHIYHEHANKVWKCNKCPMEFKKYHQLRQHRIFLHSTKIHSCTECSKTFKRKGDLTEHIKRLHSQRVVLLCPRCPKQYVNRFKLRNHLMKHHDVPWEDTLAKNYARHQRANNCRRTEEGILEATKEQQHNEDTAIFIEESYGNFGRQGEVQDCSDQFEGHIEEHEYCDPLNRQGEEHVYRANYRGSNNPVYLPDRSKPLPPIKMEREEPQEEYIEIMEATDAFAKDGITYVIIEEA